MISESYFDVASVQDDRDDEWDREQFELEHPLVYLACPYSHPDRDVRLARFHAANVAAARLMQQGLKVFSPISHTHPIAEAGTLPLGWNYWHEFDRAYLQASHKLIVLMVDGWKESTGVTGEIDIAHELRLPIEYLEAA